MRTPDCPVNIEAKVWTVFPAVRNPVRARNFLLSKTIPTRSRTHTVPCSMGIWAPSLGVKRPDVLSGFRREVAENVALLGYYAVSRGNLLRTFRDNLLVPTSGFKNSKNKQGFLNPDNRTIRLSRNVGKKLPLLAV